jgi:phospholipase D1/2
MLQRVNSPHRTVHQVVDKGGNPAPATATSNVWVGRQGVFSEPTSGNKIQAFTTGVAYFNDIIDAVNQAASEICIAGWQVSWDALLKPGTRLYDILLAAAKRGVKIHVMPWDDTNPLQTYDDQTKFVLESINSNSDVKGSPVTVVLAKSLAKKNNSYFSHHQKQVIIDRKIAYVGGIDLCYGRYDDATYDLHADKDGREVMNRYNGCIAWVGDLKKDDPKLVDPDYLVDPWDRYAHVPYMTKSARTTTLEKIAAGGWQVPYQQSGTPGIMANSQTLDADVPDLHTLDPARQPRMPWQDVHARIEGPAVSDLLRNFVRRWNAHGGVRLAMPKAPDTYEKPGKASIQVLRSAPQAMVQAELKALGQQGTAQTENDIGGAMLQLIEKSSRFIYIENQFFVSAFGEIGGPQDGLSPAAQFIDKQNGGGQNATAKKVRFLDANYHFVGADSWDAPPSNQVCAALIKRVERAILDKANSDFHVYITLPVHSEGTLSTASIAVQVYWTMQTLVFGSHSLLNGIRRALKARELLDKGEVGFRKPIDDPTNTDYQDIPVEKCFDYVTLLNLRNWTRLNGGQGERYVTEQIYVHSKLMIVDDLYALFGSANINDRSLLGERDSEIAVLVVDDDSGRADVCGQGSQKPVRSFAHNLRMDIWKKLFGITGGVRPASDLQSAIEAPGIPDSWRRIQKQAEANAAIYEAAFPSVPRNWSGNIDPDTGKPVPASILPTWNTDAKAPSDSSWGKYGNIDSPLPFQAEFWDKPRHDSKAVAKLDSLRGFITALPIHWTEGENIRFAYPTAIVVMNDKPSTTSPQTEDGQVACADNEVATKESG